MAGEPMRYRVYLPPCYGVDDRLYPTLYMFGGNIHDDAIWDTLGLDEAAEAMITRGDIPPLLIVMPDNGWLANTTTSGPNSYEGFVLNELIPHVETTYRARSDADGRAVGGLSRGGYWSLMMAFRRPDLFRSVGAHSPAPVSYTHLYDFVVIILQRFFGLNLLQAEHVTYCLLYTSPSQRDS